VDEWNGPSGCTCFFEAPRDPPRTKLSIGNPGTSRTRPGNYPLLLFYHPLNIYRHQVIKQADVVLAMFLLGHEFSLDAKQRNFAFYDPLTTGDSSLSSCIQAVVAAEIGHIEKAVQYARTCCDGSGRRAVTSGRVPHRLHGWHVDDDRPALAACVTTIDSCGWPHRSPEERSA
jgi:hypothetical protein